MANHIIQISRIITFLNDVFIYFFLINYLNIIRPGSNGGKAPGLMDYFGGGGGGVQPAGTVRYSGVQYTAIQPVQDAAVKFK